MSASLILQNANIVTVDENDSVYTSIAIAGQRVLAIGSDDEIAKYREPDTLVLDLEGRTVTPGLVDSHNHTCEYGFSEMQLDLRYPGVKSIQDIVDKVREKVETGNVKLEKLNHNLKFFEEIDD